MRILILFIFFFSDISHLQATEQVDPAQIPLTSFFANSKFNNMVLSKDGKHIAILYSEGNSSSVAIMTADLKKVLSRINFGEYKYITSVTWLTTERYMLSYRKQVGYLDNRTTNNIWVAYDIDGDNGRKLMTPKRARYSLVSTLPNNPEKILVSKKFTYGEIENSYAAYEGAKLFHIDIDSGREKYLSDDVKDAIGYAADTLGNPRAAIIFTEESFENAIETGNMVTQLAIKRTPSSSWEKVDLPLFGKDTDGASASLLGFDKTNSHIYVASNLNSSVSDIYSVNINTLKTTLIHDEHVAQLSGLGYFYHKGLESVAISSDYNRLVFLSKDSEMKKLMTLLYASFNVDEKTTDIQITSFTDDGNQLLVKMSSDKDPGIFYLFNRGLDGSKPELRLLDVANSAIDPSQMASMVPFTFDTRDETTLHGYYVLPKTGEPPFPMVQIIHGGPHGVRNFWGWDREAQFLASRGYAVVKVNFRGSGGYGQEFEQSGYLEWGGKMVDDMTDTTMWMVNQGLADIDRLCVYGASYGGYGALQSLVREPDLYKCGIGYVGVYSLPELKDSGDTRKSKFGRNYLNRVIGNNEEQMRRFSPAFNVDKIKAALFIAHGSEDIRVPMEQYKVLSDNLNKAGKPYISMVREEGHGFAKDTNRYDFYATMESFFEQHLKK